MAILLQGCASLTTKKFSEVESGQFESKVLVRDKVESKSGIVNVTFRGIKDKKLRLDVLSPLQTHLASLSLNGDDLKYILPPEKKSYRGIASAAAMQPILRIPMDPKLLYNLFFDIPISDKNWSCTQDKNGFLKDCQTMRGDLKIKWVSRSGEQRVLEVDHAKAFLQINIHKFKGAVSAKDPKLDLKIPDSYKAI